MTGYPASGGIGGLAPSPPTDCDNPQPPAEILPIITQVAPTGDDGRFVVFGQNFINNDYGVIDSIEVTLDDASVYTFYSTTGPNAGLNPAGTSEFTLPDVPDTDSGFTVLNNDLLGGHSIVSVTVRDAGNNYSVVFEVNPPAAIPGGAAPDVNNAIPTTATVYTLYGTALDTPGLRWRVVDDLTFDTFYYDSLGPDAGLNPPGATVTIVSANEVTIDDPALIAAGIAPTLVQTRDNANVVLDEFYPLTYPLLQSICSPAADTVRFNGLRFLTATAGPIGYLITRLLDYSAGPELNGPSMQYEFADGSPDPVYDWVLVSHTDTEIEISNPRFSSAEPSGGPGDFVVTGAAFHDPTATSMYYYEPWGLAFATPVDGSGC